MNIITWSRVRWGLYFSIPVVVASFVLPAIMLLPLLFPAYALRSIGVDLSFGPEIGPGDVFGFFYLPEILPAWIIAFAVGYYLNTRVYRKRA